MYADDIHLREWTYSSCLAQKVGMSDWGMIFVSIMDGKQYNSCGENEHEHENEHENENDSERDSYIITDGPRSYLISVSKIS